MGKIGVKNVHERDRLFPHIVLECADEEELIKFVTVQRLNKKR